MFSPPYSVVSDLLLALDLNEGFYFLPRIWSGEFFPFLIQRSALIKQVSGFECLKAADNQG